MLKKLFNKIFPFKRAILEPKNKTKVYNSSIYRSGLKLILEDYRGIILQQLLADDDKTYILKNIDFHLNVLNDIEDNY